MALGYTNTAAPGTLFKSEVKTTLRLDGWKPDGSYEIDLSDQRLCGDETFLIDIAMEADEDAKEDFAFAVIEGKAQSETSITLQCQTMPIEDIPIVIVILR